MTNELGASAKADRAATPAEPSPAVSGIAGIPCAVHEARERAERYLAHVIDCRKNAIEAVSDTWNAKIARARRELKDALDAEKAIRDGLHEWTVHDGGECPVGDVRVLFRTKWEWEQMLDGKVPSLTNDHARFADTLRWAWSGKDWDDIAAYRVVDCDSDTRPQDGDAEQGSTRE